MSKREKTWRGMAVADQRDLAKIQKDLDYKWMRQGPFFCFCPVPSIKDAWPITWVLGCYWSRRRHRRQQQSFCKGQQIISINSATPSRHSIPGRISPYHTQGIIFMLYALNNLILPALPTWNISAPFYGTEHLAHEDIAEPPLWPSAKPAPLLLSYPSVWTPSEVSSVAGQVGSCPFFSLPVLLC